MWGDVLLVPGRRWAGIAAIENALSLNADWRGGGEGGGGGGARGGGGGEGGATWRLRPLSDLVCSDRLAS